MKIFMKNALIVFALTALVLGALVMGCDLIPLRSPEPRVELEIEEPEPEEPEPPAPDYATIYHYEKDTFYEIWCHPQNSTDVYLKPGERVLEPPSASDPESWIISSGENFEDGVPIQHIYIKPAAAKLESSLIVNTNERVYYLILRSYPTVYMPIVRWTYPSIPEPEPEKEPDPPDNVTIYHYEKYSVYEIYCQPQHITNIYLKPGESVLEQPSASDPSRWSVTMGESVEDGIPIQHIYVKPSAAKLESSLIVNTNERVYYLTLRSYAAVYMPIVLWTYPYVPEPEPEPLPDPDVPDYVTNFDYKDNAVYEIYCQPLHFTDIYLKPGERITEIPLISDTDRWFVSSGEIYYDENVSIYHIYVKPSAANLEASLVIKTNERNYYCIFRSYATVYMPIVRWTYPPVPVPPPPPPDLPNDADFIIFTGERYEKYRFVIDPAILNRIETLGGDIATISLPLRFFYEENDVVVALSGTIRYSGGFTWYTTGGSGGGYVPYSRDVPYTTEITLNPSSFGARLYDEKDILQTFTSNSLALPITGTYSNSYYEYKYDTFESTLLAIGFTEEFMKSLGPSSILVYTSTIGSYQNAPSTFNITPSIEEQTTISFTTFDPYVLQSRNFYQYKSLKLRYKSGLKIHGFYPNPMPHPIVRSIALNGDENEISVDFYPYNEPYSGPLFTYWIEAEDGTWREKIVSIE